MKLSTAGAIVGLAIGLLTLAAAVYNSGRGAEHAAATYRRLCEHVLVLEQIAISEHPAYAASIYVNKGCEE